MVFDLRGAYTLIFLVFAATAAAGSLLVTQRPASGAGRFGLLIHLEFHYCQEARAIPGTTVSTIA